MPSEGRELGFDLPGAVCGGGDDAGDREFDCGKEGGVRNVEG